MKFSWRDQIPALDRFENAMQQTLLNYRATSREHMELMGIVRDENDRPVLWEW